MAEGELPPKGENREHKPSPGYWWLWDPGRIRPGVDHEQLQRYRRDLQIADVAGKLAIPQESLFRNETVATYVGVVRDVGAVMDGLYHQAPADGVARGSPLDRRFDYVCLLLKSTQGILCETLERDPITGDRIDGGDQPQGPAMPWNLADRVGEAVSAYTNWLLVEEDQTYEPKPHKNPTGLWLDPALSVFPHDPYAGRPEPQLDVVVGESWWYWGTPARERQDPEHLGRIRQEAERLGVAASEARTPATHAALTHLLTLADLTERTADTQRLPPAPGLDPAAQERFRRINPLLR